MQLLWEKQNSIHLHLSPEYFVCYAKAGDRNERSCYWILILRKRGQFMGLAHTVRWLGEGLMLSVRATAMTPKRVQFRHIRTLAWSFFMFILKILAFLISGLLKQMFAQNDSKSPQNLNGDTSTDHDSSWQPPILAGFGEMPTPTEVSLQCNIWGCLLPCWLY